jgi:hypothetical protein
MPFQSKHLDRYRKIIEAEIRGVKLKQKQLEKELQEPPTQVESDKLYQALVGGKSLVEACEIAGISITKFAVWSYRAHGFEHQPWNQKTSYYLLSELLRTAQNINSRKQEENN